MNQSRRSNLRRYHRFFVNLGRFYQRKDVKIYTEVILSLLTVSFFLFFAIKPTAIAISGLVKKIEDQKIVSEKMAAKIQTLATAQENYRALKPDLYLADEALPKNPELTTLAKQLETLARQNNIKIKLIQFDKVNLRGIDQEETGPIEIKFTLKANGLYPNLKSFLQSLDSLRRITNIKEFGVVEADMLELNLEGNAFYLITDTKQNGE